MSIQDDLRKLTTGGPGVTHIASETLFNDAADEIEKLEFAITRWKKYEADAEAESEALRATVARQREALEKALDTFDDFARYFDMMNKPTLAAACDIAQCGCRDALAEQVRT